MIKNWEENKKYCKEVCEKNPKLLMKKETKGGFNGDYLTWTLVHKWLVKNFVYNFEFIEAKTSIDGSNGYIVCKLTIFAYYDKEKKEFEYLELPYEESCLLSLETFKRFLKDKNGNYIYDENNEKKFEFYQESPEALLARVKVKLVANMTGFGFHLWEK